MRPKNFPGRKNERREAALARLPHRVGQPTINETDRAATESNTLANIGTTGRHTRTKKQLATGSPERRARHAGKLGR